MVALIIILDANFFGAEIVNPYFIPKWSAFLKMPGPSHQPCGIHQLHQMKSGARLKILFCQVGKIIQETTSLDKLYQLHLDKTKPV